jgi:hypothetical protein
MSEAKFLEEQAELAKAAMKKTLNEALADAGHVVDVRRWTEAYPWTMVGVAALAGLIATAGVLPDFRKKHGAKDRAEPSADGNGHGKGAEAEGSESDKIHPKEAESTTARVVATLENLTKFVGVIRPVISRLLKEGFQHAREAQAQAEAHAAEGQAAGAAPAVDPSVPRPGDAPTDPESKYPVG